MCLQKPRLPAAHDLSNIFAVSLLKTTMQEYSPHSEFIYSLDLLHHRSRVPLQQKHIITSRKQVDSERFSGGSKFFWLLKAKAYPFVRCLFSSEFWKNYSTTECSTSGISSREEVQPSVGMASPSRNFSTGRSSRLSFLSFLLLGFSHLDLLAAAYPNHIWCTSWFFKIKIFKHPIKTSLAYSCSSFGSRNIETITITLV